MDEGSDGPPPLRLHLDLSTHLAGLFNQPSPTNATLFRPERQSPGPSDTPRADTTGETSGNRGAQTVMSQSRGPVLEGKPHA